MAKQNESGKANIQANDNSVAVGKIEIGGNLQGNLTIGNTGYTPDEVSTLLAQITSTFQPKPFDGRCPYKGLDVFEEEDAELFFGREKLVDELVRRVKESRTVFITGPSGSGKSSLVRAGLIPALKQGKLKGSERWLYATMKPGRDPFEALAIAFSRLKSPELGKYFREHSHQPVALNECAESALSERKDQRLVLFIDQFEEVFTQINQEEERIAFLNLLTHAADAENGRVILLFSMRSDFLPNCAAYPELNATLNRQFIQIGAMQPDELVSAIAQPALRVGLRIDYDLIAQIINDMKGEPGALPLMSFALKDLFDAMQSKGGIIALTLNDYLQSGGIQKSLERHADAAFEKLNKHEQGLARSIFSGLIEVGRGTQDTKRTAIFDELIPANASANEVESIVQKLADARLITTDESAGRDTVTISHEKLIDAWSWLKKLVNENREVIALQNEIAEDTKEWEEHKKDASYLYSGARLVNANEQLKTNKLVLSGTAFEYIRAGQARQQKSRVIMISAISTVIIMLILAVGIFSSLSRTNATQASKNGTQSAQNAIQATQNFELAQQNNNIAMTAQANANIARAGELAAMSNEFREKDFLLSTLFAIEAYKTADTSRTENTLLDAANANPQMIRIISNAKDFPIAINSDGKFIASITHDNKILLSDFVTGQPVTQLDNNLDITTMAFSPNGEILATGDSNGMVVLWNVNSGTVSQPLTGLKSKITSISFSPDDKYLAAGSDNGKIMLWRLLIESKNSPIASMPLSDPFYGENSTVYKLAFHPDEKEIAALYEGTFNVWDITQNLGTNAFTQNRQPSEISIKEEFFGITSLAFQSDGDTLVISDYLNNIYLLNTVTQASKKFPLGIETSGGGRTIWETSTDGKYVLTQETILGEYCFFECLLPNQFKLWDVTSNSYDANIYDYRLSFPIATSPDLKHIATDWGEDTSRIILWDISVIPIPNRYALNDFKSNMDLLIRMNCQRIGRNFTREEWEQYFPNEVYRTTCDQLPPEPEATITPTVTP